ncbi:RNA methyltransferase [Candidatus Endowatersipora endosymbiont of Watersipora subatra]|uniref:RNA methyltransferase n=1 Tax=Candidatus Endowatersipora endosymbiont of Watersipora subatra TaxID=3077946 RepID=UPI00312C6E22
MAVINENKDPLTDGPIIVLVNPQLGENIGAAARAMANFGLVDLRLVNPRDCWPSPSARSNAAKAYHIIDHVTIFDDLRSALYDLQFVYATTARQRAMLKLIRSPREAAQELRLRHCSGQKTGILFGCERAGLKNSEIELADEIITFPVNPDFTSVNIAQSVLLMSYEWMTSVTTHLPMKIESSQPAEKDDLFRLFDHLEGALDRKNHFYPPHKRSTMVEKLRNIFQKARLSKQEIQALRGVLTTLEGKNLRSRSN